MMFAPKDLDKHITATYRALRLGVAIIAFAFPLVLGIGGYLLAGLGLEGSMSAYYHAGDGAVRNWFVGILFAVGTILFVYQGYTKPEDYALNLAGILAWGVALFPTAAVNAPATIISRVHGTCAIGFFLCIAYVCIFRASDTLSLISEDPENAKRKTYALTYKLLGVLMVAFPLAAFVFLSVLQWNKSVIFFVEAAGVYAFAAYWVVKSREISETQADNKAACGELTVGQRGATPAFRSAPVKRK
jgi:hypothetical protein